MGRKLDLVGKKFGKLTVKEFVGIRVKNPKSGSRPYHASIFKCICGCGMEKDVLGFRLVNGHTRSCGCFQKESLIEHRGNRSLPDEQQYALNSLIAAYKYGAKARGHDFSLTESECEALFKGNCVYCGVEPNKVHSPKKCRQDYLYNGIDRIDNFKGYISGNCASCCTSCNKMKMNHTVDKFLEQIAAVYARIATIKQIVIKQELEE